MERIVILKLQITKISDMRKIKVRRRKMPKMVMIKNHRLRGKREIRKITKMKIMQMLHLLNLSSLKPSKIGK